jgi:hypothetical protein
MLRDMILKEANLLDFPETRLLNDLRCLNAIRIKGQNSETVAKRRHKGKKKG